MGRVGGRSATDNLRPPPLGRAGSLGRDFAQADLRVVHNDDPEWRALIAADFSGMCRKVVVDGRRILERGAMKAVELIVIMAETIARVCASHPRRFVAVQEEDLRARDGGCH